jgi:hypothetical protein
MTRKGKSSRKSVKGSRKQVSVKVSGGAGMAALKNALAGAKQKKTGTSSRIEKKWSAAGSTPSLRREGKYVTVSHSIQVAVVKRSVAAGHQAPVISRYDLNPRNQIMFPWMSNIASLYDQAHLTKAVFRIVPTCGGLATGEMALAFDPDATDATPTSISDLTNMRSVVGAATSDVITLDVSNMNITPWIFVGANPSAVLPANTFGQLFVGSASVVSSELDATNEDVGVLWVDFTLRFRYPEMITTDVANSNTAFGSVPASPTPILASAIPKSNPGSAPPAMAEEGTLPFTVVNDIFGSLQGYAVNPFDVAAEYEVPGLYKTTIELAANTTFTGPTPGTLCNPDGWPLLVYKNAELLVAEAYELFDKKASLVYNVSDQITKVTMEYWLNVTVAFTRVKMFYNIVSTFGAYVATMTSERVPYAKGFTLLRGVRKPYYIQDVVAEARLARRQKLIDLGVKLETCDEGLTDDGEHI